MFQTYLYIYKTIYMNYIYIYMYKYKQSGKVKWTSIIHQKFTLLLSKEIITYSQESITEKYINKGTITVQVKNWRGERLA